MSRIKKALERAKAQGTASGRQEQPGLQQASPAANTEELSRLRYFRTKVIDIPREVFIKNRIVTVLEEHPVTDEFKLLRTQILNLTRDTGRNTIQVSGFDPGEGKSMIALNLAVSMARDTRQTTLLVDVDFRRPSIHSLLGLPDDTSGLKQYFENQLELEDCFINPGIDKLTILPAGGRMQDSTEVVGSARMEALVSELKRRYPERYIIFDSPGLNVCPDPLVFSQYVDGVILVARSDFTKTESIKAGVSLLPREKLLGTVLNDSRWQEAMAYSQTY